MSDGRDALWYLMNDRTGEIAALDRELDRLDWEINYERRRRHEETRERLERLGYDVSDYKPLPYIHPSEQRCRAHPPEDIEAFVTDAKLSLLDRAWAEHRAKGEVIHHPPDTVLRRRFDTEIKIR